MFRRIVLFAILFSTNISALSQITDDGGWFLGVATIDEDGKLCLKLVSKNDGEPIAHGYLCYEKTHPKYDEIAKHVGSIGVGQEKEIKPWQ